MSEHDPNTVGAFEAKTHFSRILDCVERGESVLVTRRGREVARIVPVQAEHDRRTRAAAAFDRMKQTRKRIGRAPLAELAGLPHEGHRL
ncbi:MAG: type II toxin-antitoxin system Phd/YefM family antitoxin [Phycisphaeraceae bacterium]